MKMTNLFRIEPNRFYLLPIFLFAALMLSPAVFVQTIAAQQSLQPLQPQQLSLADILIALRSKKATLPERNKILADAVKSRGITFALTPEIEKELGGTGADIILVDAIRQKNLPIKFDAKPDEKIAKAIPPKQDPVPLATPPPPDFIFYKKRADGSVAKGDLDSAIGDYNRALELKPNEPYAYLSRGIAFFNKKNYDLSAADFSKAIELNPKDTTAYLNRGNSYEKLGELEKAVGDYLKAVELDPANEPAKTNLQRLQAELQAKLKPAPKPVTAEPAPKPGTVETAAAKPPASTLPANIGSLKNYAVKLAMPVYSALDRQRNLKGIVTVEVSLDEEGKILSVKAINGPPSLRIAAEEAARRSRFNPVTVGEKAIKAMGFINYNFAGQ